MLHSDAQLKSLSTREKLNTIEEVRPLVHVLRNPMYLTWSCSWPCFPPPEERIGDYFLLWTFKANYSLLMYYLNDTVCGGSLIINPLTKCSDGAARH